MAKRDVIEKFISRICAPERWQAIGEVDPIDLLIIRNNDIGDLILTTPLFQALKRIFHNARIHVGIGDWNKGVLDLNPYVDKIITLNAPWHNKVSCRHSPNSPLGFLKSMLYIYLSAETRSIHTANFSLGIDVLGSQEGTVMMHRCNIPNRMGTRGYAGGHTGCQKFRDFQLDQSVAESILEYPKLLSIRPEQLPSSKPQIYLSKEEIQAGLKGWEKFQGKKRIVISTGAGFEEKCWPVDSYKAVATSLSQDPSNGLVFIGSAKEAPTGKVFQSTVPSIHNLAGQTNLRETFAILSHADLVICNSTMFMHVAAAFDIPNIVLLGPWYDSAKLHAQQWGHPHTIVMGREVDEGHLQLPEPKDVIPIANQILEGAIP